MPRARTHVQTRKPAKILLVDDHPVVLHGLAGFLDECEGFQVCGKAEDADAARRAMARLLPDLVIVDLFLKGALSLDFIKETHEKYPKAVILVLSVHQEPSLAERALRAGADGYVVKEAAPREIVDAVRDLLAGKIYLSEAIGSSMLHAVSRIEGGQRAFLAKLTDREMEIFKLLGEGLNPRQIAERIRSNPKTVETHCFRIRQKLRVKKGSELTRQAILWRGGLGDLPPFDLPIGKTFPYLVSDEAPAPGADFPPFKHP